MPGERILVVEDEATSAKLLVFLLRAHGYEVTLAADAPAALEAIGRNRPDVLLVDVQLPDLDGLALVRRLRSDIAVSGLRTIAVTARAMKGDRERALAAGCDDYVTKPIDTRELPAASAVPRALVRPGRSRATCRFFTSSADAASRRSTVTRGVGRVDE